VHGPEHAKSDWTESFGEYFHKRRLEVLRAMIGSAGHETSLDVGCGDGCLVILGLRNVVGIDVRRANGVAICSSAENLPFRANTFDLIFAGEVLEHLENPLKGLKDWSRVLKTTGTLIISTPNGSLVKWDSGHPEHKGTYAPAEMNAALQRIGLGVVKTVGIFTGLISGSRLFRKLPFDWLKSAILRLPVPARLSYDIFYKVIRDSEPPDVPN